jgi:hypothetical protein
MEQHSRHELSEQVRARLPRELRDVIYGYLWDDEQLDYPALMDCRVKRREYITDEADHEICVCDTSSAHVLVF